MTDRERNRELLEHAAKANDLKISHFNDTGDHIYTGTLGRWWSPLVIDGDCLRLAIALDISITFDTEEECTIAEWGDGNRCRQYWAGMIMGKTEATRHVVTRAAAEIWHAKQDDAAMPA